LEGFLIKTEPLRSYLSANIKARRKVLDISQEKLAELADVSIQMIKGIEGQRTWVSEKTLTNLARVLGVSSFQLLVPPSEEIPHGDSAMISGMIQNLRQNLQDEINSRLDHLVAQK